MSRRLLIGSCVLGAWTVLGLLIASQAVFRATLAGDPFPGSRVALALVGVYTWAAFTPLIVRVARRWPIRRRDWRRPLAVHLLTAVLLMPLDVGTFLAADRLWLHALDLEEGVSLAGLFARVFLWSFGYSILWYATVAGITHAVDNRRAYRERELRAAELEGRLTQAQLEVLKMQLQPHFLFNALHAISALVHEDPDAAKGMLARLGELLRLTLRNEGRQEVSLREELELLEPYLQIEQTRFQDRLTVHRLVEPQALEARVPNMILQPLVENAVRHGISRRARPGTIEIRARRWNGMLELEVRDDGVGLGVGRREVRERVGLGNTRARLRQLYGDRYSLELRESPGGGVTAAIAIPYRVDGHEELPGGSGRAGMESPDTHRRAGGEYADPHARPGEPASMGSRGDAGPP